MFNILSQCLKGGDVKSNKVKIEKSLVNEREHLFDDAVKKSSTIVAYMIKGMHI